MLKLYKKIVLLFSVLIFSQTIALANEQNDLKEHFLKKIDEVVLIVEDKKLSKDDRNAKIIKSLTPMMDFELMAKLSLGNVWKELSKSDADKFVSLYVERMKQSYSSKIDAYKDEKIQIKSIDQAKENKITFLTDLVSKENRLEIAYKFHKPKDRKKEKDVWLIYDVEISGVSILKTDIVQFKEFLQTKNINELMEALAKKA